MSVTRPDVGYLARFVPKTDRVEDYTKFVLAAFEIVKEQEPLTVEWYGFYDPATNIFFAFDAFAGEEGRKQHATSADFRALVADVGELMSKAPVLDEIDLLESMVRPSAQVKLGLVVSFDCKPGKVDEVKDFLMKTVYTLVQSEEATMSWYAVYYPATNKFAILDFFSTEEARQVHLDGQIPLAFKAIAGELTENDLLITKVNVLAAKVNVVVAKI